MIVLANTLTQAQLDAANRLYARLRQWQMADAALKALADAFPRWEPQATLLKVAAINQLYGTNLYAVARMAEHVGKVMATADPATEGLALVERIAALPVANADERVRRHVSFASKLAHFFMDADRFPIYDSYAKDILERHLGPRGRAQDETHPYLAYVDNLRRLRERSRLTWAGRELDHYLWLAGQYREWDKNKARKKPQPINTELQRLFDHPPTAQDADYLTVLSQVL